MRRRHPCSDLYPIAASVTDTRSAIPRVKSREACKSIRRVTYKLSQERKCFVAPLRKYLLRKIFVHNN